MTAIDESLLQQMGDEAIGSLSTCWYSAQLDNATNKKLVAGMQRDYKVDPGFYAAATYTNGAVLEAALKQIGRKIEDKDALMKALREHQGRRDLPRPGAVRQIRQRGRQHLHPQGREEGRRAGQHRDQDLSERQPVLDLRPDEFLKKPGLQSRELAGEQELEP